jgi:hypothetical protein
MLELYLTQGTENAIERVRALDDLSAMLDDSRFSNIRPDTQDVMRKMVSAYEEYVKQRDVFDLVGGDAEIMDLVKTGTLSRIKDLSNYDENTKAVYMSLFSRLLGE